MTPEHRAAIQYLIKRLDMDGGEWPGIEVFVSKEGRHIWGLLPDDIYATLMILARAVAESDDDEDEDDEEEEL
jgi:hypothetical protein